MNARQRVKPGLHVGCQAGSCPGDPRIIWPGKSTAQTTITKPVHRRLTWNIPGQQIEG